MFRLLTLLGGSFYLILAVIGCIGLFLNPEDRLSIALGTIMIVLLGGLTLGGLRRSRAGRVSRWASLAFNALLLTIISIGVLANLDPAPVSESDRLARTLAILFIMFPAMAGVVGLLGDRCPPAAPSPPQAPPAPHPSALRRAVRVSASILAAVPVGLAVAVLVYMVFAEPPRPHSEPPTLTPPATAPLRNEALNYAFESVRHPWKVAPRQQWPEAAKHMLIRGDLDIRFILIAESLPQNQFDPDSYAAFAVNNLRRVGTLTSHEVAPATLAGVEGRRILGDVRVDGEILRYKSMVTVHNGFAYQLITFGPQDHAVTVETDADMLIGSFSLLDASRMAVPTEPPVEPFISEMWGFGIDLSALGWSPYEESRAIAFSEFEARRGASILCIVPVSLLGHEPRLDAIVQSLLAAFNFEYPGPAITGIRPLEGRERDGRQITAVRQVNAQTFEYRMHVVRQKDTVFFAIGWQIRGLGTMDDLDRALAELTISPDAGAPAPEEFSDLQKKWHATFLNGIGLHEYNRNQFAWAEPYFRRAAQLDGDVPTYVENVLQSLEQLGKREEALAYLSEHASRFSDEPTLLLHEARLHAAVGDPAGAIDAYERLLAAGYADDDAFGELVAELIGAERFERATELIEQRTTADTSRGRMLRASLHTAKGEHDQAIEMLRAELENSPLSNNAYTELFDLFYDLDRYSEAIELCDQRLGSTTDAGALYRRAMAQLGLGWYAQAHESLRLAQRESPGDATIAQLYRDVATELGRGETTAIAEPLDAVEPPAGLIRDDPTPPEDSGIGVIYDHRVKAIAFTPGEQLRTTEYIRARVLDRRGVDYLSTFRFTFDPTTERLFINSAIVRDAEKAVVWTGSLDDYYITSDASDAASQDRTANIPVAALAPGRTVELVVTRLERQRRDRFGYRQHLFAAAVPTSIEAVFIRAGESDVLVQAPEAVEIRRFDGGIAMVVEDLPAFRSEPMLPPLRDFLPVVHIGAPDRDWETVARDYIQSIADRLEVTDRIRSLAAELTGGATTESERIAAIAGHVQSGLAYRAIAFGPRALIPTPADQIVQTAFGDCKDHSLLMHLLLKAAGVESYLTLVRFPGDIHPGVPSLDQFNHMILMVPALGDRFIDATDKHTSIMLPVPYGLGGQTALVLDPQQPRLVPIPPFPPDSSVIRTNREVSIDHEGDVTVSERIEIDGYSAGWMREMLAGLAPAEYAAELRDEFDGRWQLEVTSATASNVMMPDRPLEIVWEYRIRHGFHRSGDSLVGAVPAPLERLYFDVAPSPDRRWPFQLAAPMRITSTTTLTLPEDATLDPAPRNAEHSGELFGGELRIEQTPAGLRLTATATSTTGVHPPEQYAEYRRGAEASLRYFEPRLTIRSSTAR